MSFDGPCYMLQSRWQASAKQKKYSWLSLNLTWVLTIALTCHCPQENGLWYVSVRVRVSRQGGWPTNSNPNLNVPSSKLVSRNQSTVGVLGAKAWRRISRKSYFPLQKSSATISSLQTVFKNLVFVLMHVIKILFVRLLLSSRTLPKWLSVLKNEIRKFDTKRRCLNMQRCKQLTFCVDQDQDIMRRHMV